MHMLPKSHPSQELCVLILFIGESNQTGLQKWHEIFKVASECISLISLQNIKIILKIIGSD